MKIWKIFDLMWIKNQEGESEATLASVYKCPEVTYLPGRTYEAGRLAPFHNQAERPPNEFVLENGMFAFSDLKAATLYEGYTYPIVELDVDPQHVQDAFEPLDWFKEGAIMKFPARIIVTKFTMPAKPTLLFTKEAVEDEYSKHKFARANWPYKVRKIKDEELE